MMNKNTNSKTEEQKDLIFYKHIANLFAQEKSIPQSIKDRIVQDAIYLSEAQDRPTDLTEEEVSSVVSGDAARAKALLMEEFRLMLVTKKESGDKLLSLYEKLSLETGFLDASNHNDNSKDKLSVLIHMAINKAELTYLEEKENFNSDLLLPYLEKLSKCKKVLTSSTPHTYWKTIVEDDKPVEYRALLTHKNIFEDIESLSKFLKRLKEEIYVDYVSVNLEGIEINYGLESELCRP